MAQVAEERRARRRGRRAEADGGTRPIQQLPWSQPRRPFPPVDLLSADQIEAIHDASLRVLEELGMHILLPEARDILQKAGALVEDEMVRIGRDIVEAAIGLAPEEITVHARNPEHSFVLGGDAMVFGPVGGPPNCSDLDEGRRPGRFEDGCKFLKLCQYFNCLHVAGQGVDSSDIHASIRHLKIGHARAVLTDKIGFTSSTGRERL